MVTYNWSYKPNLKNKYGITINESDDDVKPSNACYVALFGNDDIGNGSRKFPLKTLQAVRKRGFASNYTILGSGVYRGYLGGDEQGTFQNCGSVYVGDGDVVLDIVGIDSSQMGEFTFGDVDYCNLTIRGNDSVKGGGVVYGCRDCIWDSVSWNENSNGSRAYNPTFAIVKNVLTVPVGIDVGNGSPKEHLTFYNCANVVITQDALYPIKNNIFVKCNITIKGGQPKEFDRNIFHQCNFRFGNSEGNPYEAIYPDVPAGFIYLDNVDDFRAVYLAEYPQARTPFQNTLFSNPKFNNPQIGDYSLAFDSPAKNASYFGTFIGAESIGYPILARSDSSVSGFDDDTNQNLIIADNSIVLADATMDASIETKVIPNLSQRELSKAPLFGFNADRNGQYIDSFADLDTTEIPATENLKPYTPYLVAQSAITYNGAAILPGERFTTKSEVIFTTENGGACIEILEAPQRHTVLARSGNGGATKIVGDNLTAGFWYYVTGSVAHDGKVYSDQTFKATANSNFTGTGNVIEALTVEAYQHYEPGIKFTSNNVGDERLGEIVRGNGDPDYERGTGKEFPINARFIQIKYIIRVNNLKP